MKKVIASLLSVAMVAAMAGCSQTPAATGATTEAPKASGESAAASESAAPAETEAPAETTASETTVKQSYGKGPTHINMWSFTAEVPNMAAKYIELHPEFGEKYTVDVTIIATTNQAYQPALDQALQAGGEDAPDIYTAEAAFVLKYAQGDASSYAASYKDLGIDVDKLTKEAEIAPYTIDIGTRPSDNALVALGYQATGGAMIYRRSIAKEVFGTDDPKEIGKLVAGDDYKNFFAAAEKLKEKGYPIVSGDGDMWHMIENHSSNGWVKDGALNIAPEREAFLDYSKTLTEKGYTNQTTDWQEGWFADMKGVSEHNAFCFFGPAWLLNYSMNDNIIPEKNPDAKTWGDWAICEPPAGFFWGGTWLLANKDTTEKEGVAEFIQWVTLDSSDNGLQYMWANGTFNGAGGTKDCVASGKVMAKSDGKVDILGGQNMFDVFVPANANATGKNMTQWDEAINAAFREQVTQYANGQKERDAALEDFKTNVNEKMSFS